MRHLYDAVHEVKARREGCECCGAGVKRIIFTDRDGHEQLLTGAIAASVWGDLVDAAVRRRTRNPNPFGMMQEPPAD